MDADRGHTGYYSILRWRRDATRDEAKNLGVLLVSADGRLGGFKAAPLSSVSKSLHDQGLLDAMVSGLEQQFSQAVKPTLHDIQRMHASLDRSIIVTEPRPTAIPDEERTLLSLYQAFVAPHGGGRSLTKGATLSQVANAYRSQGVPCERGKRIEGFAFDLVIEKDPHPPRVVDVLSFATAAVDWTPVEHDAGHFLFALEQVRLSGFAVVRPPTEKRRVHARASYERVRSWFEKRGLEVIAPEQITQPQRALPV